MVPLRLQIRLALRLQDRYAARTPRRSNERQAVLDRLASAFSQLEELHGSLRRMRAHGLSLLLAQRSEKVSEQVQEVLRAAEAAGEVWEESVPPVPDLGALIAEIRQLSEEFGDLQIRWKERILRVVTPPITLEDIELGAFAIELKWATLDRDQGGDCFQIVALDPNPAGNHESVTHPHVRDKSLCAGDAVQPIRLALEQGRLADAFVLVRSVLMEYNPDSPHVALERWGGVECQDCGSSLSESERYSCNACGNDLCADCSNCCDACDEGYYCFTCLQSCAVCDERTCRGCLEPSACSNKMCCSDCRVVCLGCGKTVAENEVAPPSGQCPPCRAKAGVSTPSSLHLEHAHEPDSSVVLAV